MEYGWNGLQLQHRPDKIVAKSSSLYLQCQTSGNRKTITVIVTINATGGHIPPQIIVKTKRRRSLNSYKILTALRVRLMVGWTKQGIALLWFKKLFLTNIRSDRPQIQFVDGHGSHSFIELISWGIKNIIIVEIPAHMSHWLQPCDRTVFGPLKRHYNTARKDMMKNAEGGS